MRISALVLFGTVIITAIGAGVSVHASDATLLGTGIGAATGGLIGSQFGRGSGQLVTTGVGVAVGGLIGNEVGHEMDAESPRYTSGGAAMGNTSLFSDSIPYGTYTPNYVAPPAPPPTYADPTAGTYCRPFSQEILIDGTLRESYGTACLQPDGSWRVVQ